MQADRSTRQGSEFSFSGMLWEFWDFGLLKKYRNIIGMCFSFNPRCGGAGLRPAGAYESLHGLADGWIWDMIVWHSGLWDRPTGDINARAKRRGRWLLLIHGGLAVVREYLCSKKTQEGKKSDSGISNSFLFSDGVKPWDKGWHKEEPKRSRHSNRWRRTRKKEIRFKDLSLSPTYEGGRWKKNPQSGKDQLQWDTISPMTPT